MGFKKNNEWSAEDRDQRQFDLLGFIWGMIPNGEMKSGFGTCNHCMFAEISAEKEQHPEGLGEVLIGANITCGKKVKLPKGMRLMGNEFKTMERCTSFIPKMCELCNLAGFRERLECESCIWEEN